MTDHRNPPRSNWQEKNIKTSRDDFPFAIYTRKFNSSPLKVMMVLIKRSFPFPILLGFRPIFRGRLLLNFRGVCFTQRVCVCGFRPLTRKKLAIYSVFSARASSPWARGFSCNSSFGRNCCNTEGPSIAKDILCSPELPSWWGNMWFSSIFCSLKAMWNKYYSTCNIIKVVNFLKCLSPSSEFMAFFQETNHAKNHPPPKQNAKLAMPLSLQTSRSWFKSSVQESRNPDIFVCWKKCHQNLGGNPTQLEPQNSLLLLVDVFTEIMMSSVPGFLDVEAGNTFHDEMLLENIRTTCWSKCMEMQPTPSGQQGTHISSCRALAPWWSSSSSSSSSSYSS